nr:DUF1003 domain-containing protein [Polymorphobacter sp.]
MADPPAREPASAEPTAPPPAADSLSGALSRNIEAVARRRAEDAANTSRGVRIAARIGAIIGRMTFVYAHVVIYGGWLLISRGMVPGVGPFDPKLGLMGSVASIEGIFLSLFILIAQNNSSAANDRRDDLSLQVGLLSEHEITQLIKVTAAIAAKLGIDAEHHGEIADL